MLSVDRCDRCGAQAYTAWWKAEGKGELMLCAHHARVLVDALTAQGWRLLIDDRDTLLESVRQPEEVA